MRPWLQDGRKVANNGVPLLCARCPCGAITPCPLCVSVRDSLLPDALPRQADYIGFRSLYDKGEYYISGTGEEEKFLARFPYYNESNAYSMPFVVLGGNITPTRVGVTLAGNVFFYQGMQHLTYHSDAPNWWIGGDGSKYLSTYFYETANRKPRCAWVERVVATYTNNLDTYSWPAVRIAMVLDYIRQGSWRVCGVDKPIWEQSYGVVYTHPTQYRIDPQFLLPIEVEVTGVFQESDSSLERGLLSLGINSYYNDHRNTGVDFHGHTYTGSMSQSNPLTSVKINGVELLDPAYVEIAGGDAIYTMPSGIVYPGRKVLYAEHITRTWAPGNLWYGLAVKFDNAVAGDTFHFKTGQILVPFGPMSQAGYDLDVPSIDVLENGYVEIP